MKYSLTLLAALIATWLLWSGHFKKEDSFLLILGGLSCLVCLAIAHRMKIVDSEGVPMELGIRPQTLYLPWLIMEIVKSNLNVTRIILSRKMPLNRCVVDVTANQKTELGKVILANSITLTPGTVAVGMHDNKITVHGLSSSGDEEEISGEMDRRVCRLEQGGQA